MPSLPLHKRLVFRTQLVDLYTVDGAAMRARDVSAIGGAHHLVHKMVPRDEAWIERGLGSDGRFIAAHELAEIYDMRAYGWSYSKAHNRANELENALRHGWLAGKRGIPALLRIAKDFSPRCAFIIARVVRDWPSTR
jgi:hypothetical protein